MPNKAGRLSRLWKELKRRNVHRSLAIYAGTAFIILEAATIIFPRWDLPDWTIDLVLYLLILGAFITLIVAWIFDITPQGVQKTKPLEEEPDGERPADSKVWKAATYISLVVIVALIILNIAPIRNSIKSGDIQSLVVLPFDNFTGDDQLEYFVSGMHASLIGDMGQVGGLRVISKTSSNTYKDVDLTIPEIALELSVDAVVETHEYIKAVRFIFPFDEEVFISIEKTSQEKGLQAAFEETVSHLEAVQESSFLVPVHMANRYSRIHQYDKLLDQLELGFQVHDQNMPYIANGFNKLTPVYKDPRFIALMEKLKLPMPED